MEGETKKRSTVEQLSPLSWDVCALAEEAAREANPIDRTQKMRDLARRLNDSYDPEFHGYVPIIALGRALTRHPSGMTIERYQNSVQGYLGSFSTAQVLGREELLASVIRGAKRGNDGADEEQVPIVDFVVSFKGGFAFTQYEPVGFSDAKHREWSALLEDVNNRDFWPAINENFQVEIKTQELLLADLDISKEERRNKAINAAVLDNLDAIEYQIFQRFKPKQGSHIVEIVTKGATIMHTDAQTGRPKRTENHTGMQKREGVFAGLTPFVHANGNVDVRAVLFNEYGDTLETIFVPCSFIKIFECGKAPASD